MSQSIKDAVKIIQIILNSIQHISLSSVRKLRIKAIKTVAQNRGVSKNAVRHSITTALNDEIWKVCEFDNWVFKYLDAQDQQIIFILNKHAKTKQDKNLISTLP